MGRCRRQYCGLCDRGSQQCCLLCKTSLCLVLHLTLSQPFSWRLSTRQRLWHAPLLRILNDEAYSLVAFTTARCVVFGEDLAFVWFIFLLWLLGTLVTWSAEVRILCKSFLFGALMSVAALLFFVWVSIVLRGFDPVSSRQCKVLAWHMV